MSLVAGSVFLMYVNRDQWFFYDEWNFLVDREIGLGPGGLFDPHNEHWSTIPILLWRGLFAAVGVSTYTPYVATVVVAHLAVVHLVWRLMRRSGIEPWIATAFCAAYVPFGPGADNLLWAFQVAFVGSVALGLIGILLADRRSPPATASVWGVSVLGLMVSGISVFMVVGAAVAAWLRRGWRAMLLTASVPAAVYLVWQVTEGRQGVSGALGAMSEDSLRVVPQFLWWSLRAVLELGTPTVLVGVLPLGLSLVALVRRRRRGEPLPYAALAAAAAELVLLAGVAVGRASFGPEAAEATRYVHIGAALLLPLLLLGLSDVARTRAWATVAVAALALPWGIHNALVLIEVADQQAERERLVHEQIVAAIGIAARSEVLGDRPDPLTTPDLELAEAQLLRRDHGLRTDIPLGTEARIRAQLALNVTVSSVPELDGGISLAGVRAVDATLRRRPDGCLRATVDGPEAALVLPVEAPGSLRLEVQTPTMLSASVEGIHPVYFVHLHVPGTGYLNVAIDEGAIGQTHVFLRFPSPLVVCPMDAPDPEPKG